jgi:hypothetical protein
VPTATSILVSMGGSLEMDAVRERDIVVEVEKWSRGMT